MLDVSTPLDFSRGLCVAVYNADGSIHRTFIHFFLNHILSPSTTSILNWLKVQ